MIEQQMTATEMRTTTIVGRPGALTPDGSRSGGVLKSISLEPDHALVVLCGNLDAAGGVALRDELDRLLEAGVRYLVLDLGQVDRCTPAAVSALASACRQAQERQGWLRFVATAECVMAALDSANLVDLFALYRAVEACRNGT